MKEINPASLLHNISKLGEDELPPVHLWNPPLCQNVDMKISRDGKWYFMNSPIGRERMVRLFSKVLRYDDDGNYYLVTPVEKIKLEVEDKPFLVIDFRIDNIGKDQIIYFETNTNDIFQLNTDHPLRVTVNKTSNEPSPYVLVRSNLEGLISRNIFYKLVDISVNETINGITRQGIWSNNSFFSLQEI